MTERQRKVILGASLYAGFWIFLAAAFWVRHASPPNPLILVMLIPLAAAGWDYRRAGRE